MPALTQCIPFQHQLSVAVGSQDRSPQCPIPGGHGHPRCSLPHLQWEGAIPLGGRSRSVGGSSVCVCAQLGEEACLLRDGFKAVSERKSLSPGPPLFQRTVL